MQTPTRGAVLVPQQLLVLGSASQVKLAIKYNVFETIKKLITSSEMVRAGVDACELQAMPSRVNERDKKPRASHLVAATAGSRVRYGAAREAREAA